MFSHLSIGAFHSFSEVRSISGIRGRLSIVSRRSSIDQVDGRSRLSPEHQIVRREPRGLMLRGAIGREDIGQNLVPLSLMAANDLTYHRIHGSMKSLN